MTEGTPKAIEPKGIVRNATKIGVQDGQAEDLINLRFMDGSWRASGDGRLIDFTMNRTYSQLYVHTNIYHHLLGVYEGTLYWFAEIGTDGTSFYPLDNTTDRSLWPEEMQDLPTEPKRLTEVVGDIRITQTGHLLTVIDEADDFEYFVFKKGEEKYVEVNIDANGKETDRSLYPFGQVHFNYVSLNNSKYIKKTNISTDVTVDGNKPNLTSIQNLNNLISTELSKHRSNNILTGSILAIAAVKLYDNSYIYASQPVYIHPFECINYFENVVSVGNMSDGLPASKETKSNYIPCYYELNWYDVVHGRKEARDLFFIKNGTSSNITRGGLDSIVHDSNIVCSILGYVPTLSLNYEKFSSSTYVHLVTRGYELTLSVEDINFLEKNKDIFKSLCIFITTQEQSFDLNDTDNIMYAKFTEQEDLDQPENSAYVYYPSKKSKNKIFNSLLSSSFFLLKEYESLSVLYENPIIDLSSAEDAGVLTNLTKQKHLETESTSRTTYLPKVSYMYNGRLHIANYKSYPFFGYPIDLFHLHNHSVKVQSGSYFKGVLPNLAANNDEYLQYTHDYLDFTQESAIVNNLDELIAKGAPFFLVKVYIDGSNGEQVVSRYIPAYNPATAPEHTANFIEALNPLLTYPDSRAKKMEIYHFYYKTTDISSNPVWVFHVGIFELKPHPYLNIAYYIKPDLKPISIWQDLYDATPSYTNPTEADMRELVKMLNAEEYFPNGLKVSKTDDPMYFQVENTYQVGSAEILALMSNTIAVGTGQTGDAPLYIFCKDGVYALYVDSSGQMAYPNARILARDVCNNPRSVTPIDAGVVFTTDRGLMMIAGEQVQEIGAPAEGDVVQFWNAGSVDYSKIATASMQQIAGLPSNLCSTTDFLTYLKDKGTLNKAAIVNYNHNLRELIVSNPNYPYSYVLDRERNWSRRDYTAAQYVINFPTSYRLTNNGEFYKLDEEGDETTSLEHRKEADNKIFYLSNVIKLDSIGFKQAYRFVVRGYFETLAGENIACVVEGSYDGRKFKPLGYNRKSGKFRDIGCVVERTDVRFFRICLSGQVTGKTRIDYMEMSAGASMLNTKIR